MRTVPRRLGRFRLPSFVAPVVVVVVASVATGCVASSGPSGSPTFAIASAQPSGPSPTASPVVAPTPEPTATPATSIVSPSPAMSSLSPDAVQSAAREFLALSGVRVSYRVERTKGSGPIEQLISGEGVIDPATGRGLVTYDLTTLFNFGDEPSPSPRVITVAWDDTWLYGSDPTAEPSGEWGRMGRADAAERGGLVGRLPAEPIGIVRLVADADPSTAERRPDVEIDGRSAAVFLLPIPVEDAVAEGVPSDTPFVDALRAWLGGDVLPVEVAILDGRLVRIGYAIERDKAPYGGPDRQAATYEWSGHGEPIELELPPPGRIEDVP